MNFNDRKISGSTPLKDFPERYNGLISDLNSKITNLENELDEIKILKTMITSLETNLKDSLKASFGAWFDQKMGEFEQKMQEFDQKMKEFEKTFEKKTN